jgi:hypothetical protein
MSSWHREFSSLWPLGVLAFLVLLIGYAGFWPAFPLAGNRFDRGRLRLDNPTDRLLVEWLVEQDTDDGSSLRNLDATHVTVAAASSTTPNSGGFVAVSRPQLTRIDRFLFCQWQAHSIDQPELSVTILGSWSVDGENWSPPTAVFGPEGLPKSAAKQVLNSSPFLAISGEVYAVAAIHEIAGYSTLDATTFGEPKSAEASAEFPRAVRDIHGFLVRRVRADQTFGSMIPIVRRSDVVANSEPGQVIDAIDQGMISDIVRQLATPDSRFGGKMEFLVPECETEDRYRLSNPTKVLLPNNRKLQLWSNEQGLDRLYGQISRDGGQTWDKPTPTNIRQSGRQAILGNLPAGPIFLAGNQSRFSLGTADPLTISIAFENLQFTEFFELRSGVSPSGVLESVANPSENWKQRGFQVSACLVDGEWLWVAYSVNDETIELSRVRTRDLAPAVVEEAEITKRQ